MLHSVHGSDVPGTKLPTFQQWIVGKHGEEYWRTRFVDKFIEYVSDIFCEYKLHNNIHKQLRDIQPRAITAHMLCTVSNQKSAMD